MRRHGIVLLGCSWVLWSVTFDLATQRQYYTASRAEETKMACEAQKQSMMEWLSKSFTRLENGVMVRYPNGTPKAIMSYDCFPDTVDPRPKP